MCSITVNMTNNTQQGPITFSSFAFLGETGGKFSPNGPPFAAATNIQANGTSVQALYANGYVASGFVDGVPLDCYVNTSGTGVFNMPNGDTLTVTWDLDAESDDNKMPTFTPSSISYDYSGIESPTITNGNDYVFDIVIS